VSGVDKLGGIENGMHVNLEASFELKTKPQLLEMLLCLPAAHWFFLFLWSRVLAIPKWLIFLVKCGEWISLPSQIFYISLEACTLPSSASTWASTCVRATPSPLSRKTFQTWTRRPAQVLILSLITSFIKHAKKTVWDDHGKGHTENVFPLLIDLLTNWALAEHQTPDSQFGFGPKKKH